MVKTEESIKYYAFMSYSHKDELFAKWLHKKIETYRIPASLKSSFYNLPNKLTPIFRDQDELPASSDLSYSILEALIKSKFLIVVCSPNAAKSKWVNQEILKFKQIHGEERVLAVIIEGEPNNSQNECFPESLKYRVKNGVLTKERVEPIAADARGERSNWIFAKNKLIAGLLGVGFDEIQRREVKREKKRRIFLIGALGFVSSLTVISIWKWREADKNKAEVLKQLKKVKHTFGLALIQKAKNSFEKKQFFESTLFLLKALTLIDYKKLSFETNSIIKEIIYFGEPDFYIKNVYKNLSSTIMTSVTSQDNNFLITASPVGVITLWDLKANKIHGLIRGFPNIPKFYQSDSKNIYAFKNKYLAFGSFLESKVEIWDYIKIKRVSIIETEEVISYIVGDNEQDILYCGTITGKIQKWQIFKKKMLANWKAHNGTITSMKLANIGGNKVLISASKQDQRIKQWDTVNKNKLIKNKFLQYVIGGSKPVCIYLSPNHYYMFVGDNKGNVYQFETYSFRLIRKITTTNRAVVDIYLFEYARYLLILHDNGKLYKVDYIENKVIEILSVANNYTYTMCLTADEKSLFIGTSDPKRHLLEYRNNIERLFLKLPLDKDFSKSYFKRAKKTIQIDDALLCLRTGESFFVRINPKNKTYSYVFHQDANILDFEYDNKLRRLFILLSSGHFVLYDIDNHKILKTTVIDEDVIGLSNIYHSNICIASQDRIVYFFDCFSWKVVKKIKTSMKKIKYAKLTNKHIILASRKEICVIEKESLSRRHYQVKFGTMMGFDVDLTLNLIAIGRENKSVILIDIQTLKEIYEFYPLTYKDAMFANLYLTVTSLLFDRGYLYVGLFNGDLICLDALKRKKLYKINNHDTQRPVLSINKLPEKLILSCEGSLKLIDIAKIRNRKEIEERLKLLEKSMGKQLNGIELTILA